ncbi:hypothetical protein Droror1_Dr00013777 [Drosera rotundifolia]
MHLPGPGSQQLAARPSVVWSPARGNWTCWLPGGQGFGRGREKPGRTVKPVGGGVGGQRDRMMVDSVNVRRRLTPSTWRRKVDSVNVGPGEIFWFDRILIIIFLFDIPLR